MALMQENRIIVGNQAFTLIELLVVLVVISILVGIMIPTSKYISYRAKQAQADANLAKIKNALEDYRAKYGEYPITPTYEYPVVVDNKTNVITNLNAFADVVNHYPTSMPTECYFTRLINSNAPSTYTNFDYDQSMNYLEEVIGENTKISVDYSMSYPLVLAPVSREEQPYINIDSFTVLYQATDKEVRTDYERKITKRSSSGFVERTVFGRYGWPINRPLFLDPVSGQQLILTSDGQKYSIFYAKSAWPYGSPRVWRVPDLK